MHWEAGTQRPVPGWRAKPKLQAQAGGRQLKSQLFGRPSLRASQVSSQLAPQADKYSPSSHCRVALGLTATERPRTTGEAKQRKQSWKQAARTDVVGEADGGRHTLAVGVAEEARSTGARGSTADKVTGGLRRHSRAVLATTPLAAQPAGVQILSSSAARRRRQTVSPADVQSPAFNPIPTWTRPRTTASCMCSLPSAKSQRMERKE